MSPPPHPELRAQQVLARARLEFDRLDETWNDYTVDVELLATLLFELGVQHVPDLIVGERQYSAFLAGASRLIVVEANDHEHRRRFSIAHEIGHFVLHLQDHPELFLCSQEDMELQTPDEGQHRRQEWEANLFAGELLMPEQPLIAMFRATGGRLSSLARHFRVSPKALEIRLDRIKRLPFSPRS